MLSPMRYPGGKSKLLSILAQHLTPLLQNSNSFCDAFVGGGSVLLDIAEKYPNIKLFANDKDIQIYSFWKIISSDDVNHLVDLLKTQPTIDLFYKLKEQKPNTELDFAYKAIFFNRTSFSGINKTNSSPIGGKNQNSKYKVDCRYNSDKLSKKIQHCHQLLKDRLTICNLDIANYLQTIDVPVYADPPYLKKGKELYQEYMTLAEHSNLCNILKEKQNWILSYDNCQEIIDLYNWADISFIDAKYCINGFKSNWKECKEVLIKPKENNVKIANR